MAGAVGGSETAAGGAQAASAHVRRCTRRALLAAPVQAGLAAAPPMAGGAVTGGGGLTPAVQERLAAAMREAIAEARQARFAFGAVLLDSASGETVYRARNTGESGDPTAHAEVNVLRGAGLAGLALRDTVLVTTAESCPMCAAAEVWARVAGVVFGTSIAALIRYGWAQIDLPQAAIVARSTFWSMPIVGGYLVAETDPLYAGGPPG